MFAGLISIEQSASAWGEPDVILAALAPYSLQAPRDVWATDRQLLMQVATRTGATSADIHQHAESGVAVAFWGRLDNRPELARQLQATHEACDDELIALAWLKWGEHFPERLIGDFALAVASPRTGTVFLARDVMGVKPLFYRADADGVFFANSAAAFKPLKLGSLTPSQEWMAKFLLEISYHHTDTAYHELKKLPGAHSLLIHADGSINLRRYHRFVDDAPVEKQRNGQWLEAYQAVWREAVACRMPATGMIGTENSGGLDSGSITAELARQLGEEQVRSRLFGFGFAYEALEPEYIMAVARHCRIANTFLVTDSEEDPEDGWFRYELSLSGYPNEHPNGTSHTAFYRECGLQDIGTLFSGFGGDEAVTLTGRALRRELFERQEWRNLWQVLPGAWPLRLGRMSVTAWRSLRPGFLVRRETSVEADSYWRDHFIQQGIVDGFGLRQANIDSMQNAHRYQRVNEHALDSLSQPFLPTRLGNCSVMASAFGVEYVWPMLDQRLVQQWLSTPSIWKLGPQGVTRYLHRRAVADVGPEKMVWKQDKNMGNAQALAHWDIQDYGDLFHRMRCLAADMPAPMQDFVDSEKLKRFAKAGIENELTGYKYAYRVEPVIRNMEMLEQWLGKT